MRVFSQTEVLDIINAHLDPHALLQHINYYPDKIQLLGTTLKCFCPIHSETAFRSLIIDTRHKTYKCTMKHCHGFDGGSLIDLYALHTKLPPLQAAFTLVKHLNIQLPEELGLQLDSGGLLSAEEAYNSQRFEEAKTLLEQVLEVNPNNSDARVLFARTLEALERHDEALAQYQFIAGQYTELNLLDKAIAILEKHVIPAKPKDEELLLRLAELHERLGSSLQAIEIYCDVCRERENQGEASSNLPLYQKILALDPRLIEIRRKLAETYEATDALPSAVDEYVEIARLHEAEGSTSEALAALERARTIDPANLHVRQILARLYLALGNSQAAQDEYLTLGNAYLEHGDLEQAMTSYQELLNLAPELLEAREALISILVQKDELQRAAEEYADLATLYRNQGNDEKAIDILQQAKSYDPSNTAVRELLCELYMKTKNMDALFDESIQLAELLCESSQLERGRRILEQLPVVFPHDLEKRRAVARDYEKYHQPDEALREYLELARTALAGSQFALAEELCGDGLQLEPENVESMEIRLQALVAQGKHNEAVEACKHLSTLYAAANQKAKAIERLRQAIELLPSADASVYAELAQLYQENQQIDEAVQTLKTLAQIHLDTAALDDATRTVEQILRIDPANLEARRMLATIAQQQGDTGKAIDELSALADICIEQNEYQAAREALLQILELDPVQLRAMRTLAHLTLQYESVESALPLIRQVIGLLKKSSPEDEVIHEYRTLLSRAPKLRKNYAEYLKEIGRTSEAVVELLQLAREQRQTAKDPAQTMEVFKQVLTLEPNNLEVLLELATLSQDMNDSAAAISYYHKAAKRYCEQEDYDQAYELYNRILRLDSVNEPARRGIAEYYIHRGQTGKAIKHLSALISKRRKEGRHRENIPTFLRILELEESNISMREQLAELYGEIGEHHSAAEQLCVIAEQYSAGRKLRRAIDVLTRAVNIDPKNETAHLALIDCYLKEGQKEKAKETYSALVDLYLERGAVEQAEALLKQIRQRDPDDIELGERLGKLYEIKGDVLAACNEYRSVSQLYMGVDRLDKAIEVLQRSLELDAGHVESRKLLAHLFERKHNLPAAAEHYLTLVEMLFQRKEHDEALHSGAKLLQIVPDDTEKRIKLTALYAANRENALALQVLTDTAQRAVQREAWDQALRVCEEGLRLDEQAQALREIKIQALLKLGQTADAIAEYMALGDACFKKKEFAFAEQYYRSVIELNANDIEAHEKLVDSLVKLNRKADAVHTLVALAQLHEQHGELSDAIAAELKALKFDDTHLQARDHLAQLYIATNDVPKALSELGRLADGAIAQNEPDAAIRYLSRILSIEPQSLETLRTLARVVSDHQGLEQARPYFAQILEQVKTKAKPKAVMKEYEYLLTLDPQNIELRKEYATYLQDNDRPDQAKAELLTVAEAYEANDATVAQAIDTLIQAQNVAPDDMDLVARLASVYDRAQQRDEAYGLYVQAADAFCKGKQGGKAIPLYERAAELNPHAEHPLVNLAQLYERISEFENAVATLLRLASLRAAAGRTNENIPLYVKVLQLNPDQPDIRKQLALLYEAENFIDDAVDQYAQLAESHEQHQDYYAALQVYEHIKQLKPADLTSREKLVRIHVEANRLAEAKQELSELGDLCLSLNKIIEAERYFRRVQELDPSDLDMRERLGVFYEAQGNNAAACKEYLQLANALSDQENFSKAVELLEKIKSLDPDNPTAREYAIELYEKMAQPERAAAEALALARRYFKAKLPKEAVQKCKQISTLAPLDITSRLEVAKLYDNNALLDLALEEYSLMANRLFESGRYGEILRVCNIGLALDEENVQLHSLKVRAYLVNDDIEGAIREYKVLAPIFGNLGRKDEEQKVYREIVALKSDDIDSRHQLVRLYRGAQQTEDAISELLQLVILYKKDQNFTEAAAAYRTLLQLDPENLDARNELAQLLTTCNQTAEAIAEYFTLARAYESRADFDKARSYYQTILSLDAENLDTLKAYRELARNQNLTDEFFSLSTTVATIFESREAYHDALQLLNELIALDPTRYDIWERIAQLHEKQGDTNEAIAVYQELSRRYEKAQQYDKAINQCHKIAGHQPENIDNLVMLAALYRLAGATEQAIDSYISAITLLRDQRDLVRAKETAEKLLELDPVRTDSRALLAQILEALGEHEQAADAYAALATLHQDAGHVDPAIAALAATLRLSPDRSHERLRYANLLRQADLVDDAVVQYLQLARYYEERGQQAEAASCCQNVLELEPDNLTAHQHLARLYSQTGSAELAKQELEWLGGYYSTHEQYEQAEQHLLEALQIKIGEHSVREKLGALYSKQGKKEDAIEQFLKITELAIRDGSLESALSALEHARDLSSTNTEIRKHLAEIYGIRGESEKAKAEIIYVIDTYLGHGLVEEAQTLSKSLLNKEPENWQLRERIAQLFEHHDIPELAAAHYTEIARFHKARESLAQLIHYTQKSLALTPDDVAVRQLLIEALTQTGQLPEAYEQLNQLTEQFASQGAYEKAIQTLNAMCDIDPRNPYPHEKLSTFYSMTRQEDEAHKELKLLADIYSESQQPEEALRVLKVLLNKQPDDVNIWRKYIDTASQLKSATELLGDYAKMANVLIAKGAVLEATRTFETMLRIVPHNAEILDKFVNYLIDQAQYSRAINEVFRLADIYNANGQHKQAARMLLKVQKVAREYPEIHIKLGETYLLMNAKGMAIEQFLEAVSLYKVANEKPPQTDLLKRIIDIDANNVNVRNQLIDLLLASGQVEEAVEQSMQIADLYVQRDLLDLAEKEYRRILSIDPENLTALNSLAATHLQIGMDEDVARDYLMLAELYLKKGALQDAVKYFKKALSLDPQNVEAHRAYIDAYLQFGVEKDLIEDYLVLADLLLEQHNLDGARRIYMQILALDPEHSTAKGKLREIEKRIAPHEEDLDFITPPPAMPAEKRLAPAKEEMPPQAAQPTLEETIDTYQNILQLNPANAQIRIKLADLYEQIGRQNDACKELDQASQILIEKGELEKCIAICERLEALRPADQKVRNRLAKAILQRDSFKAIESAIVAYDTDHPERHKKPPRPSESEQTHD
jgi:tetratricopeptide (TPR) repeat protein